ncbi:MAG: DUF5665 domain-containing protein, partial [bacterium]
MTGRDRARIDTLLRLLERARIEEIARRMDDWRRLILTNLLAGLCRGLGFTLGVALLGALAATLVRNVVVENIPLIG